MIQRAFFMFALILTLDVAPILAAPATLDADSGRVTWNVDIAFDRADLLIHGPSGFSFEKTFLYGETPTFSVYERGEPDSGSYSWHLTVVSGHSDELRDAMMMARETGDTTEVDYLKERADFRSFTQSGRFSYDGFELIVPGVEEQPESDLDQATKDHSIVDNLIVEGSACVGMDCVVGESFGFDTIRLKENNLRIRAIDTSSAAGFPTGDWQLTFNDSFNSGKDRFSIETPDNSKVPFTLEHGAPSHSLYIDGATNIIGGDKGGDIGIGTDRPQMAIHVARGDSPTLRLEQNGSIGFTPQTWDVAGNETNFFVRDTTNGNILPFRIRTQAPANSLFIDTNGDVGLGTNYPQGQLHVVGSDLNSMVFKDDKLGVGTNDPQESLHVSGNDASTQLMVEETHTTSDQRVLMILKNNGYPSFRLHDTNSDEKWNLTVKSDEMEISKGGTGVSELRIDGSGNLTVLGTISANNGFDVFPDYVFEKDYNLMPLDQLAQFIDSNGHLPRIPSAQEVEQAGSVNMTRMQYRLLEKIEELTLYTLSLHERAESLQERAEQQSALIEELQQRLDAQ